MCCYERYVDLGFESAERASLIKLRWALANFPAVDGKAVNLPTSKLKHNVGNTHELAKKFSPALVTSMMLSKHRATPIPKLAPVRSQAVTVLGGLLMKPIASMMMTAIPACCMSVNASEHNL